MLSSADQQLSYRDLDEQSTLLAAVMKEALASQDSRVEGNAEFVAIAPDRNCDMITAIIASIKAGLAWVPLDSEYPDSRIQYILEDCQPVLSLTSETQRERMSRILAHLDHRGALLSIETALNRKDTPLFEAVRNKKSDIAYAIYTSGTTGNPKGTMLRHDGLLNLAENHRELFQVSEDSRGFYSLPSFLMLRFLKFSVSSVLERVL